MVKRLGKLGFLRYEPYRGFARDLEGLSGGRVPPGAALRSALTSLLSPGTANSPLLCV